METRKNILVIENQQYDFDIIIANLPKDVYDIYPKDNHDQFVNFMNHVYVALNGEYDPVYRKIALKYIKDIVDNPDSFENRKPADLILMDHILGGAHHCFTGIDLSHYINMKCQKESKSKIPVVFLSRTPESHKKKLEGEEDPDCKDDYNLEKSTSKKMGYEKYKNEHRGTCKWVHKGYSGEDFDEKYFNKYVIEAINDVLPLSEKVLLKQAIDFILDKENFGWPSAEESDIVPKLKYISNKILDYHEDCINEFKSVIFEVRENIQNGEKHGFPNDSSNDIIINQFNEIYEYEKNNR